jgi:hypothetical protein
LIVAREQSLSSLGDVSSGLEIPSRARGEKNKSRDQHQRIYFFHHDPLQFVKIEIAFDPARTPTYDTDHRSLISMASPSG